jgi:ATP-dependent Lon protease
VIEVSLVPGAPGVEITGGRGKMLKESVRSAYNLVCARATDFGVPADRMARHRVLVHLVHIAEEREGPSAGVAFVVGIVSAASGRPVKPALAFTGEVSLHGKVTSVAGVAQKVKTAHGFGRKTVIIPRDNAPDLEQVADALLEEIEVVPVETIEEVLGVALMEAAPPEEPVPPDERGTP